MRARPHAPDCEAAAPRARHLFCVNALKHGRSGHGHWGPQRVSCLPSSARVPSGISRRMTGAACIRWCLWTSLARASACSTSQVRARFTWQVHDYADRPHVSPGQRYVGADRFCPFHHHARHVTGHPVHVSRFKEWHAGRLQARLQTQRRSHMRMQKWSPLRRLSGHCLHALKRKCWIEVRHSIVVERHR